MTDRFLQWKLPDDFAPDGGISAARPSYTPDVRWEPTGTNLLDARQATDMVRFIVGEDIPMLADTPPGRGEWFDLERRWRDKHDELRARAEKAEAERDAAKSILSKCADAIGNGAAVSQECSIEFMSCIPREIGLHVASLTEDLGETREQRDVARGDAFRV